MRGNNVLGIVFSNMKDDTIRELTEMRTMGSVPFGGRYRLIDFPLSNMTHSGISRVGVVTKSNYRSLMDHVGSGKAWGLSRKHTGLVFLPPYGSGNAIYQNRIGALSGIREYLEHNHEEFVFMTDCDTVVNMDIQKVVDAHLEKGADITIVCKHDMLPNNLDGSTVLNMDSEGRVHEILLHCREMQVQNYDLSMYVMRREFLLQLINDAMCHNYKDFKADLLQAGVSRYRIFGYMHEGFAATIHSMNAYYQMNMRLLDPAVRAELFQNNRPIYTKVRDDMPARYGIGASVKNNVTICGGCIIGAGAVVVKDITECGVYVGVPAHKK